MTTPSSSSPPTMAPKYSPGPMAAPRRSRSPRGRSWKAASACRPSCAGPAMFRQTRCRTVSSPAWAGSLPREPSELHGSPNKWTKEGRHQDFDGFKVQFWRFVFVHQVMGKELRTSLEFPPMQRGASFNLDAVKAEMGKKLQEAEAASKGTGQ